MNFIKTLFLFGLLLFLTLPTFSQTNHLSGVWKYQPQESEKTVKKVLYTASAPESLILIIDEKEATVNEIFTEIVQTRTVKTESVRSPKSKVSPQVYANFNRKRLKIETIFNDGKQLIETYESSGKKLKVTFQLINADGQKILTRYRIYQRTLSDIYAPDNSEN